MTDATYEQDYRDRTNQDAVEEVTRLRNELAKANNEFGSMTSEWPDLWRRIADLKETSNDRWKEVERLKAELEALRENL